MIRTGRVGGTILIKHPNFTQINEVLQNTAYVKTGVTVAENSPFINL